LPALKVELATISTNQFTNYLDYKKSILEMKTLRTQPESN